MKAILAQSDYRVFSLELSDRFGNAGIVGVVIIKMTAPDEGEIDTFCLSCRAFGYEIETFLIAEIIQRLKRSQISRLHAFYINGERNWPVANLYDRLGFTKIESHRWQLDVKTSNIDHPEFISICRPAMLPITRWLMGAMLIVSLFIGFKVMWVALIITYILAMAGENVFRRILKDDPRFIALHNYPDNTALKWFINKNQINKIPIIGFVYNTLFQAVYDPIVFIILLSLFLFYTLISCSPFLMIFSPISLLGFIGFRFGPCVSQIPETPGLHFIGALKPHLPVMILVHGVNAPRTDFRQIIDNKGSAEIWEFSYDDRAKLGDIALQFHSIITKASLLQNQPLMIAAYSYGASVVLYALKDEKELRKNIDLHLIVPTLGGSAEAMLACEWWNKCMLRWMDVFFLRIVNPYIIAFAQRYFDIRSVGKKFNLFTAIDPFGKGTAGVIWQ